MVLQKMFLVLCALAFTAVLAQRDFGYDGANMYGMEQAGLDNAELGYPHHHLSGAAFGGGFFKKKSPFKKTSALFGGGIIKFKNAEPVLGYASPVDTPHSYHARDTQLGSVYGGAIGYGGYAAPAPAPAPALVPTVPCGSHILIGCAPRVAQIGCSQPPRSYGTPSLY